ncbi:MAG TPA: HAMP domain-containing sensor histidine kinase [Polyangia bacterium]|nr:HAMP domain-containing sensor histidine kinase [Polyangia bacterium]
MEPASSGVDTHFAPAERSDPESLARLAALAVTDPVIQTVLEAVGGLLMVLDKHRQILAANRELLDGLKLQTGDKLVGQRPGEALGCIHSQTGPGGCGTSLHCCHCGAVLAILAAQTTGRAALGECTLAHRDGERVACAQYRVKISPLPLAGGIVLACVLHDITATRRRELLERVFMHDTRNVLAGLQAWSEQLREEAPSEAAQNVVRLVEQLLREVESQSVLLRAEIGDLRAHLRPVHVNHVMQAVETMFKNHPCSEGKDLLARVVPEDTTLVTDESLLLRVLGNMVKNALEASPPASQVRLWFERTVGGSAFHVHNPGSIPPSVAAHIFQPHFSSKGRSRGFGTYAMRLIGEHCLGGRVSFVSDAVAGTQFSIELP